FARGRLVLLRHHNATASFQPLDALLASGTGGGGLHGLGLVGSFTALLIKYHERLATHARIALLHAHITAEGCFLLLITDFQCRSFDVDGLIAILRKPLQ